MTKYIAVRGAQPHSGDQEVEPACITISGCFPRGYTDEMARISWEGFKEDAEKLFSTLLEYLPGGTFDRLLSLMLQEKAGHLIVSHQLPSEYRKMEAANELYKACKRALHLVEDEDNNKLIVEMPGSFGLLLDLQNAIEKAEGKEAQDV